jgi:propionate CoA-transferase
VKKFVRSVQQVTFSGGFARERKQPVLYVTERAVFSLEPEGLVLREIAPGVELQRDVLGQMEFAPLVAPDLKPMSAALFTA